MLVTASVPTKTKVPALVKLERVSPNPARVTVEPALMVNVEMVTGAVMIAVVSLFNDGTARPMVATIAACAIGAATLAYFTLGRRDVAMAGAE